MPTDTPVTTAVPVAPRPSPPAAMAMPGAAAPAVTAVTATPTITTAATTAALRQLGSSHMPVGSLLPTGRLPTYW